MNGASLPASGARAASGGRADLGARTTVRPFVDVVTDALAEAEVEVDEVEAEAEVSEPAAEEAEVLEAVEEVPADTVELTEEIVENPLSGENLVSEDVAAAAGDALKGLDTLEAEIATQISSQIDGSKSVEQLMTDILRPMLKNWLDANLPSIVKVIVTEQVEKVIRSRMS